VSLASIGVYIGVRTMVPRQQALMATPAGVHIGTQVLAVVGIEPLE
jgi:hypothetical protein